jgi:hypothetical protein
LWTGFGISFNGIASAGDYLSTSAPGSPLSAYSLKLDENSQKNSYFAVLNAQVTEIDWLELGKR